MVRRFGDASGARALARQFALALGLLSALTALPSNAATGPAYPAPAYLTLTPAGVRGGTPVACQDAARMLRSCAGAAVMPIAAVLPRIPNLPTPGHPMSAKDADANRAQAVQYRRTARASVARPSSIAIPGDTAASTTWSIVPTPNQTEQPTNSLASVSCLSASDCWAVGTYTQSSTGRTLTEHWDGRTWTHFTSPNLDPTDDSGLLYINALTAVSCVSTADCWAVGDAYYYDLDDGTTHVYTVTEHWNGNAWSLVSSPNTDVTTTDLDYLYGVSCVSTSDCWAVGSVTDNPIGGTDQTLIEHYDGTAWSLVTSANSSATASNALSAVSCVSSTQCFAVGSYVDSTGQLTLSLIEHWDGTAWTMVTSANTTLQNYLQGISCASATDCQAVGYSSNEIYGFQTFIEHWNGTTWSTEVTGTDIANQDRLDAVFCNSVSDCWATGGSTSESGTTSLTLVEHYDGTTWSVVTAPSPGSTNDALLGVACTSTSQCWSVGSQTGSFKDALTEQWNGTAWVSGVSASIEAPVTNVLSGVACLSASNCWAAGSFNFGTGLPLTLIQQWDGSTWSIVSSANVTSALYSDLVDVACNSASDCWAVGESESVVTSTDATNSQTLAEHWDGTAWSVVSTPDTSASLNNTLTGITCVSSNDCWAVGYASATGNLTTTTLIEQWNGSAWSIITSPNTGSTQSNVLYGVTCASASACWAVGYSDSAGISQTLIEQWNGTAWTIVASTDTGAALSNLLSAVTCVSAHQCWAVGYASVGNSVYQSLIEQWDGTSWATVASPQASATQQDFLDAIACTSATDCRAVGGVETADGESILTLAETWDGNAWSTVTSANVTGSGDNRLLGVTCVSSSDCWSVGSDLDATDGVTQTLVEQDLSTSGSGGSTGTPLAAPTASLSATPLSGTVPLPVAFDGSASTTPNAGATITAYRIDFGDGSPVAMQSLPTVSHTYTVPGRYLATLTVFDSTGASSGNASQQTITVSSPSATASSSNPGGAVMGLGTLEVLLVARLLPRRRSPSPGGGRS